MKTTVSVEGLRELDAALGQLTKAVARNTLRRVLRLAARPIAVKAQSLSPILTGQLRISIGVGTRLTRRQASLHRRESRNDKAFAEVFVGAGGLAQATLREFGTDGAPPAPFMRPAWDAHKTQALDIIKRELGTEIAKSAARAARRAAAKAARA